jgi:hypothetical protein
MGLNHSTRSTVVATEFPSLHPGAISNRNQRYRLYRLMPTYFKSAARLGSACIATARPMVYSNYLVFQKSSGMAKSSEDASNAMLIIYDF